MLGLVKNVRRKFENEKALSVVLSGSSMATSIVVMPKEQRQLQQVKLIYWVENYQ